MSSEHAHERTPVGAPIARHPSHSVNSWSSDYVDGQYAAWKADPASVDPQWQQFFMGFDLGAERKPAPSGAGTGSSATPSPLAELQRRVDRLIEAYRAKGHFAAQIDPLGAERPFPEELQLDAFGLSDAHLDLEFDPSTLPLSAPAKLGDIIGCLEDTYCRTIGVEFAHITEDARRQWLAKHMETVRNHPPLSDEVRLHLLGQLIEADGVETFLDKRYVGKKRFGLEGGESLIPMIDQIIELAPQNGIGEVAMGMAHRGRLNVLANILNKKWDQIFTEFDEAWEEDFIAGGGDVKYHQGYSSGHTTSGGGHVHLTLAANPSHLEFVNSVVLGRCRAKQRLAGDTHRDKVIPIVLHGDAALPAQGVVAECLNMMHLDGYTVGGTIHIVINNQVGFTTDPHDGWSGNYCTDVAKGFDVPVFHVNGDDVEACAWVARLALEWRQTFKCDVFIDMVCFRKYGHNETDEPNFTQPLLYAAIRRQKPVLQKYRDQLIESGLITSERFDELANRLVTALDEAQGRAKSKPVLPRVNPFQSIWSGFVPDYSHEIVETAVAPERLRQIAKALGHVPDSIQPHKTVAKLLATRAATGTDESLPVEWATAELFAYGSLLLEGHPVRLTGQDVERGTFSHRHAVVRCQESGRKYAALDHLAAHSASAGGALQPQFDAHFDVRNSPLSEVACVGFEYGYSLSDPTMLVIWEAQFGDFANGAQVIIDQFLASAQVKWRRSSGLTLLLPHGYEGQGPEHSSARLERFLQLCADDNMQVVYPTTSAQIFHLLRKQIKQRFRKPLVIMSPKSMLRSPLAMSPFAELTGGHFRQVLPDPLFVSGRDGGNDQALVTKVLLCSGKIGHELLAWRDKLPRDARATAVVRIEQLYPFPDAAISKVLAQYPKAERFVWVQEEPRNMGAYRFCQAQLKELCGIEVSYVGRSDSATPACGSSKIHAAQQEKILLEAMSTTKSPSSPSNPSGSTAAQKGKSSNSR
ncbi:MAG: 2-oxoglutarate dehydrogenase E1 component [Phycisphaerae bacterium]|nr:2-oxoglutarate dehydrogenase E1 component [Phycisphaerae bacterium]